MEKEQFIKRLVELRMQKGVSARDMSLSMGQNPGYINNIESGKSMPSLTGIFYICDYLGITPSEFFDMDAQNPTKLNEIIANPEKAQEWKRRAGDLKENLDKYCWNGRFYHLSAWNNLQQILRISRKHD